MTNAGLFKFACQCLLLYGDNMQREYVADKFKKGCFDPDDLVLLLSNHFVLPAVTLKFQKYGLLHLFPDEYQEHFLEILELNRKRNQEILEQLVEVSSAMENENIQPIYLKGTANLLDNLYYDVGERMIGDIDFLVPEKDYLKAAGLLLDMGYETKGGLYLDGFQDMKHYPRLFRKDVPADVEVHRIPVREQFSRKFNTELLGRHKKQIPGISNCYVSCNEHKLIHTFIHSQFSNLGHKHKKIGLRCLYDYFLLSQKVNIEDVIKQTERKKEAGIFYDYARYLFTPATEKGYSPGNQAQRFARRHFWLLDHPRAHNYIINSHKLFILLFKRYILKIIKATFQKSSFLYVYARLRNPKWYSMHLKGLKEYFS